MAKLPKKLPVENWEFFTYFRKAFGVLRLRNMFQVSQSTIYRWGADPDTNEETRSNPLDHLLEMEHDLVKSGGTDREVAIRLVDKQAKAIGAELRFPGEATPDKSSLLEEIIDDGDRLSKFHIAARDYQSGKDTIEAVRAAFYAAHSELDETFASLVKEKES